MNENKEQKKISSITSDLSLNEFKKIFKCMPNFYWAIIGRVSLRLLLVILIFSVIYQCSITETVIVYSIIVLIVALIYKIKINWLAQKTYEGYIKRGLIDIVATIDFYQNHLEKITKDTKVKIQYKQITQIVETEENIYILDSKNIININKKECDTKLIKFIKEMDTIHSKRENKKNKKESYKNLSKINHIKILLLLVFILTLFSIYGATITVNIATKNDIGFLSIKKMWLFWLWLPIPIISTILGFKYKDTEIKCKKNIIAGFVVSFLLFSFGFFTFLFPTITKDYKEINNYKDILKVELPKNGVLTQAHYDTMFDNDKTDFTITRATYNSSKNTQQLEKLINKSNYWEKFSNIKSELKVMFPTQLQNINKDNYFLIYNEDTNEYNTIPKSQGKYHIYVIIYITNERTLEINDFNYNFVK